VTLQLCKSLLIFCVVPHRRKDPGGPEGREVREGKTLMGTGMMVPLEEERVAPSMATFSSCPGLDLNVVPSSFLEK
jgi:hypothetical protein